MSAKRQNSFLPGRRGFLRNAALFSGAAALAACSPQAGQPTIPTSASEQGAAPIKKEPVKVTYMSWGGVERFAKNNDAWKVQHPDLASWITLEAASGGSGPSEMFTLFRTAMAAGGEGIPDIYESNATSIPEFASRELMLPLDNYMASVQADLTPAAQKVASFNGKMYGVPFQVKTKVWFYRKDMFEEAGIKPEAVKTVDDLIAAGQAFHSKFPDSYIINMGPQSGQGWVHLFLSNWDDLRFADEGGDWKVTKDERFAQVLEMTKKIYKSGIAFETADWSPDWQPALAESKIGSSMLASWMMEFIPQFCPDQAGKWGLSLWPEFSRYGSEAGGSVWAITKYSKNSDAAFEYLRSIYLDAQGSLEWYRAFGWIPMIKSGQELVLKEVQKKERPAGLTDEQWNLAPVNYFGPEFLSTIIESQEQVKIFPYDMAYDTEIGILGQHTNDYLADKVTLQEALQRAEEDMKNQIGNPYQI